MKFNIINMLLIFRKIWKTEKDKKKKMDENDFDAISESFKNEVASHISKEPEKIQGTEISVSRRL